MFFLPLAVKPLKKEYQHIRTVLRQNGIQDGKRVGQPLVIRIQKQHIFPPRGTDTGHPGGQRAAVRLGNQAKSGILPHIFPADCFAFVRRAVIDQDNLIIPDCLGENRPDAVG